MKSQLRICDRYRKCKVLYANTIANLLLSFTVKRPHHFPPSQCPSFISFPQYVSPTTMTQELPVYMLPYRHAALSLALYGPVHGFGERTLALEMVSGQINLEINIPVLCHCENNVPALVTSRMDKAEWELLCSVVESDGNINVIIDDGEKDHLATLGVPAGRRPRDGGVEVRFWWKESDEVVRVMERGRRWVREKLK